MEFPKRPDSHIIESTSFRIFSSTIPNDWIVREVTEKDYGIDCYVEICENGYMTGKLLSIQLKASNEIKLSENNQFATYYGVKKTTLNYWYNLPTPVFFIFIDIKKEICYYCNIKKHIRQNYESFLINNLKNIKIPSQFVLTKDFPLTLNIEYFLEINRNEYENILLQFIYSISKYIKFLGEHIDRDCFLSLEGEDEVTFILFYNNCRYLANRFLIKWDIETLEEFSKVGNERFGGGYLFYEQQIAAFVIKVLPIFKKILNKIGILVKGKESYYWEKTRPIFWYKVNLNEYEKELKELEQNI